MTPRALQASVAIACVLLFFVACADESATQEDGGTSGPGASQQPPDNGGPQAFNGACAASDRVGGFEVAHEEGQSYVSGEVADGVVPSTVPTELTTSGPCRLLRKNNPFCDPPCTAGQTCDNDGACVPFPVSQDVGTVSVHGLLQPVVMEPSEGGNLYFETSLPHPAFEAGSTIGLSAAGGDVSGFTLYGEGVTPLETPDQDWFIAPGKGLSINWTPDPAHEADIVATVSIDQHGTSPSSIVCEGADTGSLEISVELMDELLDLGVSGFPSGTLTRRTVDSVALELGCVEFEVFSRLAVEVSVESHTPCMTPNACPEGQTCDLNTNTCVATE